MKVSIAMITYNHERFIAQAIESVLMQEANFDFELVIGEDCSTDRTREIVAEYQRSYPNKIRLLSLEDNLGPNKNLARTLNACRGEYVAILEGDDYWISKRKLHSQVSLLEQNADFAMCFTDGFDICDDGSLPPPVRVLRIHTFSIDDVLAGYCPPLVSLMLRRSLVNALPEWYCSLYAGDWALALLVLLNMPDGKIKYIDEKMVVYRHHSGGIWSPLTRLKKAQRSYQVIRKVMRKLEVGYKTKARLNLLKHQFFLAYLYYEAGQRDLANLYYKRIKQVPRSQLVQSLITNETSSKEKIKFYLMLYSPWLFKNIHSIKSYLKTQKTV